MDNFFNVHLSLIDCLHKYTILKNDYIEILECKDIKIDPNSNEQIHMNLYDLNKILKKITKFIEIINDENYDKEKRDDIINKLSTKFFDRIEETYTTSKNEILDFKDTFNHN